MKYIVINSVKGGCGKTTTALLEAIKLTAEGSCCCVVDLDLLGTSIEQTISNEKFVGETSFSVNNIEKSAKYYLNDLIENDNIDVHQALSTVSLSKSKFYLLASSPDEKRKKKFRVRHEFNYVPEIEYGSFKYSLEKILKKIAEIPAPDSKNKKIDTIIIDMPPNSDSYTDTVFDVLLSFKEPDNTSENSKNTYELILCSSLDRAHISATFNWFFETLVSDHLRTKFFTNYTIRMNDIIGAMNNVKNVVDEMLSRFEDILKKAKYPYIPTNITNITKIHLFEHSQVVVDATNNAKNWGSIDNLPFNQLNTFELCYSNDIISVKEVINKDKKNKDEDSKS